MPHPSPSSEDRSERHGVVQPSSKPPLFKRTLIFLLKLLPPEFISGFTARNLKTLFRCMLAFLACLVLLFAQPSLETLGIAAFFAGIVCVMLPPSMPLSLFFIASTILNLGMLVGWAWSCAAMASALNVRSKPLFEVQFQKAKTRLATNPEATFRSIVFEGEFLDPRSSAVYGIFFFIGTFAMGALRAHVPTLGIGGIFACIVMDEMCCYGPLFPTSQYMLATILILPAVCYIAIAIASLIFVFPESVNHVYLSAVVDHFLKPSLAILTLQDSVLSSKFPLDVEAFIVKVDKGRDLRKATVAGVQRILSLTPTIDLELSVGKLGSGDCKEISTKMKSLTPRTLALVSFSSIVGDLLEADDADALIQQRPPDSPLSTHHSPATSTGTSRLAEWRRKVKEREIRHSHDLSVLLPILASSSTPLRTACADALLDLSSYLESVNTTRWKPEDGLVAETGVLLAKERSESLLVALRDFKETGREKLVRGPFGKFFEVSEDDRGTLRPEYKDKTKDADVLAARSLFFCFVFTTTLESLAESLLEFLSFTIDLRQKRPRSRWWFPSGFGKIWRKIQSRQGARAELASAGADAERLVEEKSAIQEEEEELQVNPDAATPTKQSQKFASKLSSFFRWFKGTEGLFSFRHALASIVIWIFAVHPNTAHFSYIHRGLWALIMVQTGLGVYVGNQVVNFVSRMGGTLIGIALGIVAWYVGAGRGRGNPYGLTAIACLLGLPIFYARIVLPPAKYFGWLMVGITMVLILGYSYIDAGHLPIIANSGVGAIVGLKRGLLVMIGFVVAFLVMCFPRINSARVMCRKTGASVTERLGSLFALQVEDLLREEAKSSRSEGFGGRGRKEKDISRLSTRFLEIATQLQGIVPVMTDARHEPSLRGPWPSEKYTKLFAAHWKFLVAVSLLSETFAKLDSKWSSNLVRNTPFLNPNLLSDAFAALSIVSSSLKNSTPLPSTLPSIRERLIYHHRLTKLSVAGSSVQPNAFEAGFEDSNLDESSADDIRGSSLGLRHLTMGVLTDPQLPIHSTAVVAFSSIYTCIDGLIEITRSLVGESNAVSGFEQWYSRSVRAEEEGRRGEEKTC